MAQLSVNHVALWVSDLEAMREFYERELGASAGERYHNPRTGLSTYFLTFPGGGRLEIMTRPDRVDADAQPRRGWAHLALGAGTPADVDALVARLSDGGVTVAGAPRTTGDGYYEAVIADPEGNLVELVADAEA